MPNKVAAALLGCGHFFHAPHWAETLKRDERVKFLGVWDYDGERAAENAKAWGVECLPDLEAVLASPELSAVAICAENNRHAELICRAAHAGKHVLCEKPPAATFRELDEIERAVKAGGGVYFQSFPKRFDPINQAVKKILTEGRLGRLIMARMRHGHFGALETVAEMTVYRNAWFTDPGLNGAGSFLDEGVHATDCLHWFCGTPKTVCAKVTRLNDHARADEAGLAVYTYANGLIAEVCTGSIFAAATNTVEIYGELGVLIQQGTDLSSKAMTPGGGESKGDLLLYETKQPDRRWQIIDVPTGFKRADYHCQATRAFINCVISKEQPAVTLGDGRMAVEMILAGYESARTGRTIAFPFATDRTYDIEEVLRRGKD